MNWLLIISIAKTHLLSRKKQTVIAALGVTFGIGTFITLVSFMTGLNKLLDDLVLNSTPHIHLYNEIKPSETQPVDLFNEFSEALNIVNSVQPKQGQLKIHNALALINHLNMNPKVRGAIPSVTSQVFYLAGSIQLNGTINGINPKEQDRLFHLSDYVIKGSLEDLANSTNGIMIGAGLAKKMDIYIGERIQVTTAEGGIFPLKVVCIYQTGLADIDDTQSYATLKNAQRILRKPDSYITDINVKLYDMNESAAMAKELARVHNLSAVDIITANAQFEAGTTIRNMITYSVSITLLLVSGFGIYNILNMFIYEKMNDIAILKATGFSGKDVRQIFISQAMIIGIVGGIAGLCIGHLLAVLIDHAPFEIEALPTLKTYPVNFDPAFYIIGITFAIISTYLAGYLPAQKARKIDPVQIIRSQ